MSFTPPDFNRWFADEVRPHEPALRAWLHHQFPNLVDIDDLVQESYVRILKACAMIPIESPKAYLFSTARNLALDQLRRDKVTAIDSVEDLDDLGVCEDATPVPDATARRQELAFLSDAIQSLPERCRQVLTLRKIYGLSQKEIAVELGISENTVETQVATGVRRCAEYLARFGLP